MVSTLPNGREVGEWWVFQLSINLLCYATIIVPGALIIYFVKRTNLVEKSGAGCVVKMIKLCIYGSDAEKLSLELGPMKQNQSSKAERSTIKEGIILAFCFCGLQVSYLTWGLLQEKIMTKEYENSTGSIGLFTDSQFLVFVNRVLAFIFAGTYIVFTRQPRHTAPLYKYSYCSFSNIMSSWCQYEALKFVSFPTQVLAKASKIIPVMLMGKLVSKKSYEYYEYISAVFISLGMMMFLLSRGHAQDNETVTTFSGAIILVGYMLFDSFTSNWQGSLFSTYSMSSTQMMCGVNLFSCIFTAASLLQQGGFVKSFHFMMQFPLFCMHCFLLSICSASGQMFIFYTISQFGPVIFVIMMTIRQAVAVLLSCLIYHHVLDTKGIVGVLIIFGALFFRICYGQKLKAARKATSVSSSNGRLEK
ncbi:adenosine 3'-phospho 5'-phosphosulfate transporter 1 [Tachypleus tridentatus]|uniref:adenosine 3'-phospho 5'-phosphosulfate transporter 1 n=1 Tax=Tachypleus tridentatus TaxID=6853 RepID=UPI003FD37B24